MKKPIASVVIGSAIEAYELLICMFLSTAMSQALFGAESAYAQLESYFFIIFISCLIRPLSALLFGIFADLKGRRKALFLSILLLSSTTFLIGCIPDARYIGFLSAILFLMLRILQSVAATGEYTNAIAYLFEITQSRKNFFYGVFVGIGWNIGSFIACFVSLILSICFTPAEILNYAWRFPLFLALPLGCLGFYLRKYLQEKINFEGKKLEVTGVKSLVKEGLFFMKGNLAHVLALMILVWFGVTISLVFFVFGPQFLAEEYVGDMSIPLLFQTLSYLVLIPFLYWFGKRGSSTNIKLCLLGASLSVTALLYPYFTFLEAQYYPGILVLQLLLAVPCACYFAYCPTLVMNFFPQPIRCSFGSLTYTVASSILGGLTPLCLLQLNHWFEFDVKLPMLLALGTVTSSILFLFYVFQPLGLIERQPQNNT